MNSLLLIALTASSLAGQDTKTAIDPDLSQQVRDHIAPWAEGASPGGIVCVLRDGDVIVHEGFGLADVESATPITPKTTFYIASVAKTITALCAVHAAQSGALDLDASLRDTFPELPSRHDAATLRQAIHHTSGVLDVYDTAIVADLPLDVVSSNERAVEMMSTISDLNFAAGTRFLYSNSGYVLLAEAIERATGSSLAAYAHEHVFEAFGMEHAHYHGEKAGGESTHGYRRSGSGWSKVELRTGLRGPGGVFASIEDLAQFDQALRGKIGPELREALFAPLPSASHPRFGRYAAGWMLQTIGGLQVQRHPGGAFGFNADWLRFPDQGVSVIVLLNNNYMSATDLSEEVAEMVLADEMRAVPAASPRTVTLTEDETRSFGRFWRVPATGELRILTPKPTGFVIAGLGDLKLDLVPVSKTRLEAVGAQMPYAVDLDGETLVVSEGDGRVLRLERLPFPPVGLAPATEYEGEFASEALKCTIRLKAIAGGRLRLEQSDPILELPPFMGLGPDLYVCDRGAQIDFHRDESGRVDGLTMHGMRAWGLEFVRID